MHLEAFLDKLSDGVCVSDAQGNVLFMNPAAKRMMDVPEPPTGTVNTCELLCGKLFAHGSEACAAHCSLRDPSAPEHSVTFCGRHGPHATFEWKDFSIQRQEHWSHLRVRCMRVSGKLFSLGEEDRHLTLIEDASAEIELARRKEEWRRMIAHDLRSPLSNLRAALHVISEIPAGRAMNEKEAQIVKIGIHACKHMGGLIDLFLDIAKLDDGVMPVKRENIALSPVVGRAAAELSSIAASKKIALEVRVGSRTVDADGELLERVVQNLLDNALKFAPEGGRVVISADQAADGWTCLTVKDNGPGIAPDDLPTIFDRFHHSGRHQDARLHGSGLGLIFCREAMKAMGGEIEARSAPGAGAEFVARLAPKKKGEG